MARTAGELAAHLGATLDGDASLAIRGVAAPEHASPHDLVYVDSPKQLPRLAASASRCVIAGDRMDRDWFADRTLLRTANPKLAFARAAAWLLPVSPIAQGIHPTAVIAASARIGEGVSIGPYAVVEDDAEIGARAELGAFVVVGRGCRVGADSRLYPRVTLYPGVTLGARVIVHAGAVIGSDGFGYVFGDGRHWKFPQVGGVEIGDDVEIGSNTTVDRGALNTTRIAAGVKIDNLVQVAHNAVIGEHTVVAAQTGISGSSRVGRGVLIGGQVGVADHCTIEDGAIVGAQAGIPSGKTIRARTFVWGTPARPMERFKEQYAWLTRLPEIGRAWRRERAATPQEREDAET